MKPRVPSSSTDSDPAPRSGQMPLGPSFAARPPRVQLTLQVEFATRAAARRAMRADMSEGGLFVETDNPLPVGIRSTVLLSFPGVSEPLRLQAEVRWSTLGRDARSQGMRFAFIDTTPEVEAELRSLVGPSSQVRVQGPAPTKEETSEKRSPRIVVLESNPVLRDVLQYAFQSVVGRKAFPDVRTEFTSSVGECRALLEKGSNLAIIDLDSVGEGLDFLGQLRNGRFQALPVLAVTSGTAPPNDPLTMVLRKPIALERLLKATELLLAIAARTSNP